MTLIYMGLAVRDLDKASTHAIKIGVPDPVGYMAQLKEALERRYNNRDPGIAGRKPGTKEWLLTAKRYVVVIKWVKADCKIYRILPMRKVQNRRPSLIATAVR